MARRGLQKHFMGGPSLYNKVVDNEIRHQKRLNEKVEMQRQEEMNSITNLSSTMSNPPVIPKAVYKVININYINCDPNSSIEDIGKLVCSMNLMDLSKPNMNNTTYNPNIFDDDNSTNSGFTKA